MERNYQQLSIVEREKIQSGLWEGKALRTIAFELGRSPSTLSREIKRNCNPEKTRYTPRLAQEKTHKRIVKRGKRERLKNAFIRDYVHAKLRAGYSPEQIAGRLHYEYPEYQVSHEAIYQYIYSQYHRGGYGNCKGADLRMLLKRRHKTRHPKHIPYAVKRGVMQNRISIDARPALVNARQEPGHWEGDSMVSRKSRAALNTMVERTSGLVFISKLENITGKETSRVVQRRLRRIPQRLRRTLTLDNGFENARHEEITKKLATQVYFAHPYHSWERGTNENTNGLIRWYLPKGTDFATIPEETISSIEYKLNTRPRKRLGWRTPLEVFNSFLLH